MHILLTVHIVTFSGQFTLKTVIRNGNITGFKVLMITFRNKKKLKVVNEIF